MGEESVVYLFLDTNIFMHFKMFDEVDWRWLVEGAEVVLCVARPVMQELDKHKTNHKLSSRKRDRVRKVLAKIETVAETDDLQVRDGVTLQLFAHPIAEFIPDDLDLSHADDAFVATAYAYARDSGNDVRVVAGDTGPRISARSIGLGVLKLPEEFELEAEPDELEQENKRLKAELAREQSKRPELSLLFANGEATLSATITAIPQGARHIFEAAADRVISIGRSSNPVRFVTATADTRRREIEHQARQHELKRDAAATFKFDVVLHNDGQALADDINVSLRFPDRILVRHQQPRTPEHPAGDVIAVIARDFRESQEPAWTVTDGVTTIALGRLKQRLKAPLPTLWVRPKDASDRQVLTIPASIIVGSPPREWDLTLVVKFDG